MSDFIPQKPTGPRIGGLSPKAQKLQALREKMAQKNGEKNFSASSGSAPKTKAAAAHKKTSFQRKAT